MLFDKKWLTIFDKFLTLFWKTFLWLKKNIDLKTIIFQCSKNYGVSDICNQVKSCTKHGRPDQSQRKLTVAIRQRFDSFWLIQAMFQMWNTFQILNTCTKSGYEFRFLFPGEFIWDLEKLFLLFSLSKGYLLKFYREVLKICRYMLIKTM